MANELEKTEKDSKEKAKKSAEKKSKKMIWDYFKDMITEMKKVTWPTKDELKNYSACVISFVLVSAVIIGIMDFGLTALIHWLTVKGVDGAQNLPDLLKGWLG